MKAYGVALRERVVDFVNAGGSKTEAAKKYNVGRRTVYRYLQYAQKGALAPKKSWGGWRKFDPQKLRDYVTKNPDATLWEIGRAFGGTDVGALGALRRSGITLKKTHKIS